MQCATHIQTGGGKKFRHRFEDGRTHHPLEPAVEISTTAGSSDDPTVETTMVQTTAHHPPSRL